MNDMSGSDMDTESASSRSSARRLGLAHSLLNFPYPHQLGQSTGSIRRSRSLKVSNVQLSSFVGTSEGTVQALSEIGVDETDYGQPPAKRPKLVTQKTTVCTYDDQPLKEFSLFLPSKLPASIPDSNTALQQFVLRTTATYLRLWDLAPHMNCVEIRLPLLYEERFASCEKFLKDFIFVVFQELSQVQFIEELYVPKVQLDATTNLDDILSGIIGRAAISHLYLPLSSSINSSEDLDFDYRSFAMFLEGIHVNELTIVSTDPVISEFSAKLQGEGRRIKKCSVQVCHRNEDLDPPGPDYISCLVEEGSGGQTIEPGELVRSMNLHNVHKQRRIHTPTTSKTRAMPKASKPKAKGAFSSDCTYFDEAELTTNSPFPSTIWNLDRLHSSGTDGTGTTIAIIDSGINYIHPTFKNKIVAVKNFVKNKIDNIDCVIDSDGHGTHCAGLAAANQFFCPTSSDPKSECILIPPGVAPGAKLVICKVVKTTDGDVDSDAFIEALHWLKNLHLTGRTKIDVVSISLAATYYSHRQAQVISEMTGLGIIIVCCASNVGRLHLQPIAFPARLGQVLCIGAHDENGKPTSFSPVGRELDFLSPGDNLWGPGPGTKGPFAMDCASGTSCATPAVAGLICLILQAVTNISAKNPKKFEIGGKPLIELIHNVWVMRELLKVISSSPGHHSDEIGYGTLNLYRLLDRSDEEILRIVNDIVEDE